MGGLSLWHWIIVLLVVLILFGRGRISEIMGDFGKGIKSFKEGINEETNRPVAPAPVAPPVQIAPQPVGAVEPVMPPVAQTVSQPVGQPAPQPAAHPAAVDGVVPAATDSKTGA